MKKRFLRLLVLTMLCSILTFFIGVSVNAVSPNMEHGVCYFASTQFGEDASTEATGHFHSEKEKVYVMLTTSDDESFANAVKIDVEKTKVDFSAPLAKDPTKPLKQDVGFPDPSWECNAHFTNLKPGTNYMWYATDGTDKGDVFRFKTAEGDNTKFTFTVTSDPQTYTAGARWERYNNWSDNIFKTAASNGMEIAFSLDIGDIIENSGRAEHWSYTFGPQFYKKMANMAIPGNHDFTGLVSSGGTDGRFFAAMWANPLNGPEGIHPELCYYFIYNDTLFVSLSCSCADRKTQVEWLDQVLKNNPAQYKVVSMHYPANSDATDNSKEFIPIYDKYNVDVVLFGHTHTYAVQKNYYNRKPSNDKYIGTTYISPSSPEGDYGKPVANQLFFTVNNELISFKSFSPDSVSVDTFGLLAKRTPTKDTKNYVEEDFIKSIKNEIDQNTFTSGKIVYDKSAYNNVYKMSLMKDGTEVVSKYITDSVNNYMSLSGLTPKTVTDYKLVLEYYDGTTKEIDYQIDTNISVYGTLGNLQEKYVNGLGYRYNYNPSFREEVRSLAIYVDGVKKLDAAITDRKIVVPAADLPEGTRHKIEIMTVLEDGTEKLLHESYYGEDAVKHKVTFLGKDDEVLETQNVIEGEDAVAPTAPEVEGFKFTGWDKEFTNVKSDLTVKALYEALAKTYTVTFVDKDGKEISKVEVKEGEDAKAPTAPKVEGFKFTGWDKEFTNVKSDLTVKALYEVLAKTYTVTFVDKDGKEISKVEVKEGEDAKAPTAPEVEGFKFTGWDKEFTKVKSDLTVKALYEEVKKSGCSCNSGASILFTSLMLLGLVFIRKRKH